MITLAITNYNRFNWVLESFEKVLDDNRISEIIISDDKSNIDIFNKLSDKLKNKKYEKVKLYRNDINIGGFLNKKTAISLSTNEWIILLDSDNIIDKTYIDIVYDKRNKETIYCPSHAVCDSPMLNYSDCTGLINRTEFKHISSQNIDIWNCIFNTGNCYFNRTMMLEAIDKEEVLDNPYASDSYYFVYLWFKNIPRAKLEVVPDLKYMHRLHSGSYYLSVSTKSLIFKDNIINAINNWTD